MYGMFDFIVHFDKVLGECYNLRAYDLCPRLKHSHPRKTD